MEREDISKFTNSIILISKLFTMMEDRFLKQKLHGKLSDFVSAFMEQKNAHSPTSYNVNSDFKNSLNVLLDYLEYLAHISKNNTTPLLIAQRNLLKFKLHILQSNRDRKNTKGVSKILQPHEVPVTARVAISKSSVRTSRICLAPNSSKERIFNFVKKTPDARTKDIMSEFNVLSGRTVKRSLKELTDGGFLKKRSDGAAVYYLVNELAIS